jgi:hypothetical protein
MFLTAAFGPRLDGEYAVISDSGFYFIEHTATRFYFLGFLGAAGTRLPSWCGARSVRSIDFAPSHSSTAY